MARTITEIQNQIIAAVQADSTLSQITNGSASAIWRLWTRVVATAIQLLEALFDVHKAEVETILATQKPHGLRWYQQRALEFQYGSDLVADEVYYDNTGLTTAQIEAQQIIAQSAVVESDGRLIVKVAKEVASELEPLSNDEQTSFREYMAEIKDAGVFLEVLSYNADKLKLTIDVYYDPLLLSSSGARLDGSDNDPVGNAVRSFLRALPFNGQLVKAELVDALQNVEGVFVPEIRVAQAARYDNASFTGIDIVYSPYSGFFRLYDPGDLVLNFIQQANA